MIFADMENSEMDDLINRQAALEGFKRACAVEVIEQHGWPHSEIRTCLTYGGIEKILNSVPPADAVEIVRCRDCEHYFTSNLEMAKNHGAECTMMNRRTMPEDYCSYGQKM